MGYTSESALGVRTCSSALSRCSRASSGLESACRRTKGQVDPDLGAPARLVRTGDQLDAVGRVILPGVGAAAATIASLHEAGLVDPLTRRVTADGIPFLGICIGLQVVFERSEEGPADCLGWLAGGVARFPDTDRVPQIGWNEVQVRRPHPLVAGWPEHPYCYFVNSYHAQPADPEAGRRYSLEELVAEALAGLESPATQAGA